MRMDSREQAWTNNINTTLKQATSTNIFRDAIGKFIYNDPIDDAFLHGITKQQ